MELSKETWKMTNFFIQKNIEQQQNIVENRKINQY